MADPKQTPKNEDKQAPKKEKMYELVGKRAVSVNGTIYERGAEVPESVYNEFPERVKAFFKAGGKKK